MTSVKLEQIHAIIFSYSPIVGAKCEVFSARGFYLPSKYF
jgi:hypothetical protein